MWERSVFAPQQSSLCNQLLAAMPSEDFNALQPHLESVELELRKVLVEPNTPIEHVYFPEQGFSSIVTNGGGSRIEIGIIGREGMVGVPVALGVSRMPFECFIQNAGHGLRMATSHLEEAIDERPSLHRFLLRYAQSLNVQTSVTAFANANHSLETRLARWLLMCHDRVDGDDIEITHEFMAMMLGVRRAGVTTALHILEGNQLIRSVRGMVTMRDRARLEELADDGYGLPEAEYARLMAEGR
jgi:CRP-like cAMP-binding protein